MIQDFTLRGLVAELVERSDKVDYVQVCRFVCAGEVSVKKKRSSHRTVEAEGTSSTLALGKVPGLPDPTRLVFAYEKWAKANMAPLRG